MHFSLDLRKFRPHHFSADVIKVIGVSDNPEKFDALRKAAYAFVNENGKDEEKLRLACHGIMRDWRETHGSDGEDDRILIEAVVRWVMKRYNRPRYRPQRRREERAAYFLMTPGAYEISGEIYGRASVRNTSRLTGQSKSTVARHLLRQGIAPRRQTKISKLSKSAQRLVAILDETFDRNAAGIIQLGRLSSALWDGDERRPVPPTTQSSRVKRLKVLLREVSGAGLGYCIVSSDDVCAVLRGRRFLGLSNAITWIDEEKRRRRYIAIRLPSPDVGSGQRYFWADPVLVDVMSIIDMSVTGHFFPLERLDAIFRFERLLLDPTPLLPWIVRAYHSYSGDDMGRNLFDLSRKIVDPEVRAAARRLGKVLTDLKSYVRGFDPAFDAFQMADFVLEFMDKTAVTAPMSFARLAYIRDWLETSGEYYDDIQKDLPRMLELEKAGEWRAPNEQVLAGYLPVSDGETGEAETTNKAA
ncbi:hypothetical protein ABID21_002210 [Pseudorhizobium tarimense]|uniref:Uncharacterized protein n=1 Tax=Pseudorhizobium tarimense TaxID=1079109 RepID=A0ABV2H6B9_9HYPH|nr:hypothetical protein [Pseudorhizobium tarimense]MCJ8519080.1 hypothetical protein [Pseudorhizobium tarimense]